MNYAFWKTNFSFGASLRVWTFENVLIILIYLSSQSRFFPYIQIWFFPNYVTIQSVQFGQAIGMKSCYFSNCIEILSVGDFKNLLTVFIFLCTRIQVFRSYMLDFLHQVKNQKLFSFKGVFGWWINDLCLCIRIFFKQKYGSVPKVWTNLLFQTPICS